MRKAAFDVIPVLDVARGKTVRAVKGERACYEALVTPLSSSTEPAAVVKGLMSLQAFPQVYVADLDGIEGRGRNVHLVPSLSAAAPRCEFWVDAGIASRQAARSLLAAPVATVVIGSESLETAAEFIELLKEAPQRSVLSLDFRGEEFMGPAEILSRPEVWPDRVIVMTLARVGSGKGPDLSRVAGIVANAAGRHVYAAGGVRNSGDIEKLKQAGAAGALVASALHDGAVTPRDLRAIAGRT